MTKTKTIKYIFETMEYPEDDVPLNTYHAWRDDKLKDQKNQSGDISDVWYAPFSSQEGGLTPWIEKSNDDRATLLLSFVDHLGKKCKQLLTECLCDAMFRPIDSRAAVDLLIKQFDYFAHRCNSRDEKKEAYRYSVDVHAENLDIPMLGQVLGPILAAGASVHCIIQRNNKFLQFFYILGEALSHVGLPAETYRIMEAEVSSEYENCIRIKNESCNYYCPMIVHEDSDVDSAVESIIQGAWDFCGTLTWSLTHVYVQESVYADVARKLTDRLSLVGHGSRLKRGTDLCEDPEFEDNRDFGSLEVIRPFKDCCHVVFVGWDPSDLNSVECKPGVSLLPYRTVGEVIALVNQSRFTCAASVWTERISTAMIMSEKLEVGTVWINSHGLLDPRVPFESRKEFKYPMNGDNLLDALIRRIQLKPIRTADISPSLYTSTSAYFRKDVRTAVELARSAQGPWSALSDAVRCQKIAAAASSAESSVSPDNEITKGLVKRICQTLLSVKPSSVTGLRSGDMLVTRSAEPVGTVWIVPDHCSSCDCYCLLTLIAMALARGNSVIVYAPNSATGHEAEKAVRSFGAASALPSGLLNIVSDDLPTSELYLRPARRFLVLDSDAVCPELTGRTFGEVAYLNDCYVQDKMSLLQQDKVVWLPAK